MIVLFKLKDTKVKRYQGNDIRQQEHNGNPVLVSASDKGTKIVLIEFSKDVFEWIEWK